MIKGFQAISPTKCEGGANYEEVILGGECLCLPSNRNDYRMVVVTLSKTTTNKGMRYEDEPHRITGYLRNEALSRFMDDPLMDIKNIIMACKMDSEPVPKNVSFDIKITYVCDTGSQS